MIVIRDRLEPYRGRLTERLWKSLDEFRAGDSRILPVAAVLARFDATSPRWDELVAKVAETLEVARLDDVAAWFDAMSDIRHKLTEFLARSYRRTDQPALGHTIVTTLLARLRSTSPTCWSSCSWMPTPRRSRSSTL